MTQDTVKKSKLRGWVETALIGVAIFAVRGSLVDHYHVPSGSMEPTIRIGDRLFVNKLAYGLRLPGTRIWVTEDMPTRGDVIIFDKPGEDIVMVKRLIGLPGDTLEYDGEHLSVNGVRVEHSPAELGSLLEHLPGATHPIFPDNTGSPPYAKLTVPPDKFFAMGDHRNNSADSRVWGFVPRSHLLGRSLAIIYSGRDGLEGGDRWFIPITPSTSPDMRLSR